MVTNRIIFFATSVQPSPEEIDYWVDLSDNPYGGSIKYFNGTEWVRLAASGGTPDLSNYYTKIQVNKLLNDKANIGDVDSKVDDEEVKDVIKDIQFNTSNPNGITMVMFKYDGSNKTVSIPVASTSSAGIITSKDFLDFVKQHQLQELHTEMIDTFADIRAKYQKKLIAGLNIEIDQETNVISASGDLAVRWDNITNKPDFKPVATSGDYNDLINKLKPGKDVSISEDNVISIAIDSDSLEQSLATLQSNIDKEAATARAAETKLGNAIATEKNRAESAEQTISTNLQNEIDRSTQIDTQHTNAINKEVQDRKEAIATEVSDRNAAILVETNRAKAKEEELDNKITDHTTATNAALALKADKSDTYTKAQVDAKLSGAYKVKGSSTFEALPKDNNVVGDVYNITNAFNLGGKHYDAGTNVVWTEEGWDALSGSFDTTAIEGSIQEVADNLAQEILDRTQADTTINNNISSLTNRVKVNEDKLTIWYGVSWSETSSNPDCTRIGNMDMHRTLPIQSMMKGYIYFKDGNPLYRMLKLNDSWTKCENYSAGGWRDVSTLLEDSNVNVMIKIPEFWWIDDYVESTETHNLKICPHAKPGWHHHKEAYVSAYEGYIDGNYYRSSKNKIPSVNFTRSTVRPKARANGLGNSWNIYTYNEHRAICHLFLVEYATRNSQKAVNTELTPEGFRQGGLGSGCTTGTATINGAQTWSFIPTGSSDSLGSGSGEVTVTIQQTDSSGSNTTTTTRKCNRYRGIENPFGHVWKHTDDVISVYISGYGARFWYKCDSPDHFGDSISNDNPYYKNIAANAVVTGYKTKIATTSTCDFFASSCNNGSETTYWCDYNWDNTDGSLHCLLIGGRSDDGGWAGLFALDSYSGVGYSAAAIGSRLTYLPWAE